MKRCRLMASCFLALVIALPAAGARATSLDTVKTLIEQTALPMARENDTEERITGSYSPQELSVLIAAAREAGVTLDEHTSYVLRALRRGESYWEFETIEEICKAAFGGRFWEWPVETSAWYEQTLSEAFGYEYYGSDGPTEEDLPAAEAWRIAQDALEKTYEGAKSLADPALYMHLESFLTVEEEELGRAGRSWKLTFYPLDLIHAAYSVSVNTLGEVTSMTEKAQDWSQFTVAQLENGIQHHLPPRSALQSHWSAQAWHIFRDMLPQAQRDSSWREEYDAYLASAYPLPDEADIPSEDALAIAIKDGGIKESEYSLYDRVLLADEEGRHIWKITLYLGDSLLRTPDGTQTQVSWEIDAKTGGILARSAWAPGDRLWRGYVLESVYQAATKEMLTAEEAVSIAADALRKELDEDDIPYTDPDCFSVTVSCNERRQEEWQVTFSSKDLTWGSGAVLISEADQTLRSFRPSFAGGRRQPVGALPAGLRCQSLAAGNLGAIWQRHAALSANGMGRQIVQGHGVPGGKRGEIDPGRSRADRLFPKRAEIRRRIGRHPHCRIAASHMENRASGQWRAETLRNRRGNRRRYGY